MHPQKILKCYGRDYYGNTDFDILDPDYPCGIHCPHPYRSVKESSKFQARSAFTGVGFITDESERVVNHPVRRRILLLLMILGNAGILTGMASLIREQEKVHREELKEDTAKEN